MRWDTDDETMDFRERQEQRLQEQLRGIANTIEATKAQSAMCNVPGIPGLRKVEFSQKLLHLAQMQRDFQKQLREVGAAKVLARREQLRSDMQPRSPASFGCQAHSQRVMQVQSKQRGHY